MSILSHIQSAPHHSAQYELLVEYGKKLKTLTEQEKIEKYTVSGCSSTVWCVITPSVDGATLSIRAASRSQVINGMLAVLIDELSEQTPQYIMQFDTNSLGKAGLMDILTPTRANGVQAVLIHIKTVAAIHAHRPYNNDRV